MNKISVIIPVYNEERTIYHVIHDVMAIVDPDELIIVNDGSTDKTWEIIDGIKDYKNIVRINHSYNMGKGKAIIDGLVWATGDIIAICDADQEYDLEDLNGLLLRIKVGNMNAIFGTRYPDNWMKITANKFLTWLSNLRTGRKLTDMETCFKVFRRDALEDKLDSFGFEIEAEITKKLKGNVEEVPIRYIPRTKKDGKKIKWRDGFKTIWRIFK